VKVVLVLLLLAVIVAAAAAVVVVVVVVVVEIAAFLESTICIMMNNHPYPTPSKRFSFLFSCHAIKS